MNPDDDHGESAWSIRYARRNDPEGRHAPGDARKIDWTSDAPSSGIGGFGAGNLFGRARRIACAVRDGACLPKTPFSGQVNLLTTGSFESPQQLFSARSPVAASCADKSVGAPVGEHADWTVRAALTQGDIASWIVAGSYTIADVAERHRCTTSAGLLARSATGGQSGGAQRRHQRQPQRGTLYGFDTLRHHARRLGHLRRAQWPTTTTPESPCQIRPAFGPERVADWRAFPTHAVAFEPRDRARCRGLRSADRRRHLAAAAADVLASLAPEGALAGRADYAPR